jgi:hypothetical protein
MIDEIVLKRLAEKWERECCNTLHPDNPIAKGIEIGANKCADDLRNVIKLLGDENQ